MNASDSTTHSRKISRWKTAFLVSILVFTSQACVLCEPTYDDYLRMQRTSTSYVNEDTNDLTKVYYDTSLDETQSFSVDPAGSVSLPSVAFGLADNWREVLEADGYVGIRVPQAPPAYGDSSINKIEISYDWYSDPADTTPETITFELVRRTEYDTLLDEKEPISDGHSHWEAWWLPSGDTFPTPGEDFEIRAEGMPVRLYYEIQFPDGSAPCAGCEISYLGYSGYSFWGPINETIVYTGETTLAGTPLFGFNPDCGTFTNYPSSVYQGMQTGEPVEHAFWLANYETTSARTYTIDLSSSQEWEYQLSSIATDNTLTPLSGPPYTITLPAAPTQYPYMSCLGILASTQPTITSEDTTKELFTVAASGDFTDHTDQATSLATGPEYTPELEEDEPSSQPVYIPLLLRR